MDIKRILFIALCVLLATILILTGIAVIKIGSVFGFSDTPDPTEPTEPTEAPTEPATQHVHDYVLSETIAATCDGYGWNIYTCQTCDHTHMPVSERVDPLGHDYQLSTVVEATCTEAGLTEYTCTRCDRKNTPESEQQAPLGHNWGHGQVYVATCEEGGYTEFVCMRCNLVEKRDQTEPLGHQFENAVAFPATCTEDAYTLELCSRPGCGGENKIIEENTAIGHTPDSWHTLDTGEFDLFCTVCATSLAVKADETQTYGILLDHTQVHADPSGEGVSHISHTVTLGITGDSSVKLFVYTVNDYLCNDTLTLSYENGTGFVWEYTDADGVNQRFTVDHTADLTITVPLSGTATVE
ncbi:MAG: hypothetical protein IJO72_05415 [Oscillospiraceae bacterium]|nr:hypothetical protein [Oscillospiraceae bacterium]